MLHVVWCRGYFQPSPQLPALLNPNYLIGARRALKSQGYQPSQRHHQIIVPELSPSALEHQAIIYKHLIHITQMLFARPMQSVRLSSDLTTSITKSQNRKLTTSHRHSAPPPAHPSAPLSSLSHQHSPPRSAASPTRRASPSMPPFHRRLSSCL